MSFHSEYNNYPPETVVSLLEAAGRELDRVLIAYRPQTPPAVAQAVAQYTRAAGHVAERLLNGETQ